METNNNQNTNSNSEPNTFNETANQPEMEQEKKPLGILFGTIEYTKKEDIDNFIDNLTPEQAKYCVIQALNYAYSRGVFGIIETELLSKSLRITS